MVGLFSWNSAIPPHEYEVQDVGYDEEPVARNLNVNYDNYRMHGLVNQGPFSAGPRHPGSEIDTPDNLSMGCEAEDIQKAPSQRRVSIAANPSFKLIGGSLERLNNEDNCEESYPEDIRLQTAEEDAYWMNHFNNVNCERQNSENYSVTDNGTANNNINTTGNKNWAVDVFQPPTPPQDCTPTPSTPRGFGGSIISNSNSTRQTKHASNNWRLKDVAHDYPVPPGLISLAMPPPSYSRRKRARVKNDNTCRIDELFRQFVPPISRFILDKLGTAMTEAPEILSRVAEQAWIAGKEFIERIKQTQTFQPDMWPPPNSDRNRRRNNSIANKRSPSHSSSPNHLTMQSSADSYRDRHPTFGVQPISRGRQYQSSMWPEPSY